MAERRSSEIEGLIGLVAEGRISRREFMKYGIGLGLSLGALGSLLESAAQAAPLRRAAGSITCGVANAVGKFDPHTWGLVKTSFGVFFDLDDARMLSNVRIERWLTGP